MLKKDFIKLLEKYDDNSKVVIVSTTQFDGYTILSEDIELFEDNDGEENVIIIQEKDRLK